jgi:hypothetical protein
MDSCVDGHKIDTHSNQNSCSFNCKYIANTFSVTTTVTTTTTTTTNNNNNNNYYYYYLKR